MTLKIKMRILLTLTAAAAAAAGFAAGRSSASLRICPARCPLAADSLSGKTSCKAEEEPSVSPAESRISSVESGEDATMDQTKETPEKSTPPEGSPKAPASETPLYIGNRMSRIFHDPSCRYCATTSEKYRVQLNSLEDALSQGFKPCRRCLPEDAAGREGE